MPQQRIIAEYFVETPLSLAQAAESLAGEQSTGTFTRVPGETDELRERFAARVESIVELEPLTAPSLPGAMKPKEADGQYQQGRVQISFPLENTGPNLPAIISTVAGNLFELRQVSGLRLTDLELPDSLAKHFPGPQFGIAGTRRLTGVYDRPIIGTIVKPSVGLTPQATADLVRTLGEAGVDFVKDDELMANPPHSRLADRVKAVMRVINSLADATGKKLMFAFNISDQLDQMLDSRGGDHGDHDRAEACGSERHQRPHADLAAHEPRDALRIDEQLPHSEPRQERRRHPGPVPLEELDHVEVRADRDDQFGTLLVRKEQRHVLADAGRRHDHVVDPEPLGPLRARSIARLVRVDQDLRPTP